MNLFSSSKPKSEAVPVLKQQARNNSSSDEEMNEEVYLHRNLSAQDCDSDDLEGEMNYSDEEVPSKGMSRVQMKKQKKQTRKQMGMRKANKYHVEVDTNVFEIQLDCLKKNAEIATGDAEFCQ